MSTELFQELEAKIVSVLEAINELKLENGKLRQENGRLNEERVLFKSRLDSILKKLDGV